MQSQSTLPALLLTSSARWPIAKRRRAADAEDAVVVADVCLVARRGTRRTSATPGPSSCGTYWRGSSQIGHAPGGSSLGGYCVPQALHRYVGIRRALEQRDALDVRRVREHVDRARAHEPVAVVVGEPLQRRRRASSGCTRRRRCAARRSRRAASAPCRRGRRAAGRRRRRRGRRRASRRSRSTSPTLPAKNAALPIAFSSWFSIAQATDSSLISIPHTVIASRGHREADRADAAVEVVDGLAAGRARRTRARARRAAPPSPCSSAGTRSAARGSAGRRSPPRSRPRPRAARSAGSSPRRRRR